MPRNRSESHLGPLREYLAAIERFLEAERGTETRAELDMARFVAWSKLPKEHLFIGYSCKDYALRAVAIRKFLEEQHGA